MAWTSKHVITFLVFLLSCVLIERLILNVGAKSEPSDNGFLGEDGKTVDAFSRFHEIRHKRTSGQPSSFTTAMRMPGTNWCGRGSRADRFEDLGAFGAADRCCRQHDLECPAHIPPMTTKYGLYNWRVYPMLHCSCDNRFRSCLKMASTASADTVGRMFFNVIRTQCFTLFQDPVCVERSWWGNCIKYEEQLQAVNHPPIPY